MLNRIFSVVYISTIGITSIFFYGMALVIWAVTVLVDKRRVVLHMFTSFWASLYIWINPIWSVKVQGRKKLKTKDTYVMVSNHQSQLDILVSFMLFFPFKWVSKAEVFSLPFIGWNMYLNQYIKLKRGNKKAIEVMFERCEKVLLSGCSIYLFPEGTRSKTGDMRPFKPGAFILAKKMEKPILPIVIHGTRDALPKHSLNFHGRQKMKIQVLDPIAHEDFAHMTVEDTRDMVRGIIEKKLEFAAADGK